MKLKTEKLKTIEAYLLDLDGTLYLGDSIFPYTKDFLNALRENHKKFLLLTNNSSKSIATYLKKIHKMGLKDIKEEEIFPSTLGAVLFCQKNDLDSVHLLANDDIKKEFARHGIRHETSKPKAVILTYDTELNYQKLVQCNHLIRQGLPYYATHPDLVCPSPEGPLPDTGSFIALFEQSSGGRKPEILGKPSPVFCQMALDYLGVEAERSAMVGDRIYTDMAMAKNSSLYPLLVLSGETKPEDLKGSETDTVYIYEHVGELSDDLNKACAH